MEPAGSVHDATASAQSSATSRQLSSLSSTDDKDQVTVGGVFKSQSDVVVHTSTSDGAGGGDAVSHSMSPYWCYNVERFISVWSV